MSQAGFNSGLGTRRAIDVRMAPTRRRRVRRQELEAKLSSLQEEYADLHTAIFEAAQIHRRLCAPRLVHEGAFDIASEIFAVRHLPGDFFTIKQASDGLILALGDICGKGLAAGMWTTHLVGLINAHAAVTSAPECIVEGVNRDTCNMASIVPLASLFLAKLDSNSGILDYCSAGHPPALLLRASGKLELLSEGGLLLGVVATAPYTRGRVELGPGDVLLAYSDGILESLNNAQQEFGYARLEVQLRRARAASTEAMLFSILAAVQDFAATRPLVDDMSLVIIHRRASQGLASSLH